MRPNRFARPLPGLLAAGLIALLGGGIITSHALTPTPSPLPLPLPEVTPTLGPSATMLSSLTPTPPLEITPTFGPSPTPTASPTLPLQPNYEPPEGSTTLIGLGETVEGVLVRGQSSAYFQYEAEAGQIVIFQLSALYILPHIAFDVDLGLEYIGEPVLAASDGIVRYTWTRIMPETRTYTLSLSFNTPHDGKQPYSLRRIAPDIQTLEFGHVCDGLMAEEQSVSVYRFEGAAGDIINLTAIASHPAVLTLYYSSLAPFESTELASRSRDYIRPNLIAIEPFRLPFDGTYIAVLRRLDSRDPASVFADDGYNLRLSQVKGEVITYGVPVEGELTADSPVAYYRFTPEVGDVINARVETDGALDTTLTLFGPELYELARDDDGGPGFDSEIHRYVMPEVDITVSPENDVYLLQVRAATPNDFGLFKLILDHPARRVLSEIPTIWHSDYKEQGGRYFIEAEAGEVLTLHVRRRSGPVMPQITVFQGGVRLLTIIATNGPRAAATFIVPETGPVQVQIDSNNFVMEAELSVTRGMDESE